jgi:copper chaperone CopZ
MHRTRLRITGMSCAHCVAALRRELGRLEGLTIHGVEVGSADISYDPERTPLSTITAAVDRAGYAVSGSDT